MKYDLTQRKYTLTNLWVLCLAVALAILIVHMNALAAVEQSQNVVNLYPADAYNPE